MSSLPALIEDDAEVCPAKRLSGDQIWRSATMKKDLKLKGYLRYRMWFVQLCVWQNRVKTVH